MTYYTEGKYKYQLTEAKTIDLPLSLYGHAVETHYILMTFDTLTAKVGYAFDGPSGPPSTHQTSCTPLCGTIYFTS